MLTLDEIYALQRKIKYNLEKNDYQQIDTLLAPLKGSDLENALNIKFIYEAQVDGADYLFLHLFRWLETCPESYYPYIFIASYWRNIADAERGIKTMDRITSQQYLHYNVANDQFFYWCLKALELNPGCVPACMMLLECSARYGTPPWCELPLTDAIHYNCANYGDDALNYLASHKGYRIPEGTIKLMLASPESAEEAFTPLYWLRRIIEQEPNHLSSRKMIMFFLGPNWYGDAKNTQLKNFLQSEYCSTLSKEQQQVLQREKKYDQVTSLNSIGSRSHAGDIKKNHQKLRSLVKESAAYSKEDAALKLVFFIEHYNSLLSLNTGNDRKATQVLIETLYDALNILVDLGSSWIMLYRSNYIFNQIVSLREKHQQEDRAGLFAKLAKATQFRNLASPVELLYSVIAAHTPLLNVDRSSSAECIDEYYLQKEAYFNYELFKLHISFLCSIGYAAQVTEVITYLAQTKHATNASILLYELNKNSLPQLAQLMAITPDDGKAEQYFDCTSQRHPITINLIKSRIIEDNIASSSDSAQKHKLSEEREQILKSNIALGDATSQYDYTCSLIASDDKDKIHQGLYVEAPKVLFAAQVRPDQLAYIAYLYAFCAFNARGMPKNMYVMNFWIFRALSLDPDPNYIDFLKKIIEGAGLRIFYNMRVKSDRKKVTPEMEKLMNDYAL